MKRVKEDHYSDFLELAGLNTCNTVYPMSVAEGVQRGEIYTDDTEEHQYAFLFNKIYIKIFNLNMLLRVEFIIIIPSI